jgi:hypothetical protein
MLRRAHAAAMLTRRLHDEGSRAGATTLIGLTERRTAVPMTQR